MPTVLTDGQFLGRALWRSQCGDLGVTLTRYGAAEKLPDHRHDRPYFCLVLGGAFREWSPSHEEGCRFGTAILNLSDAPHRDLFSSDGALCLNVDLSEDVVRQLGPSSHVEPAYHRTLATCTRAHTLKGKLNRDSDLATLIIHSIVLDLLADAARSAPSRGARAPLWLAQAEAILGGRLAERLTLRDLAHEVDVHAAHLARTFRKHYGMSVGEYRRHLRAARARQAIESGHRSLSHLAQACGFADQSHMTRTLRQIYGETPSTLRRKARRIADPNAQL